MSRKCLLQDSNCHSQFPLADSSCVTQIVGPEAGAACSPGTRLGERVERGLYAEQPESKYIQRRFQSGSIDEVLPLALGTGRPAFHR